MEHWSMYLFQYLVGGAIFTLGIVLSITSGEVRLSNAGERKYVIVLVLGLLGYALMHGLWTYIAIHT